MEITISLTHSQSPSHVFLFLLPHAEAGYNKINIYLLRYFNEMAQRSIFERFGLFKIRVNNHFIYSMQEPVYGEEYLCFYNDEYIGSATFTEGPFIGDCFILWEVHKTQGLPQVAIMPDKWILKTGQDH